MTRSIVRLVTLALITTTVAFAQTRRVLTTADYDRAVKMLAPALNGLVINDSVNATAPRRPARKTSSSIP